MKRFYLLIAFALLFSIGKAQNWQTVYSNKIQLFDSGLNAIKVVSKQVNANGDSIFRSYPNLLNPLVFGGQSYAKWDSVSWIGNKIIIQQNGYNGLLNDYNDTCWINTVALSGQTWDFIKTDSAQVVAIIDSAGWYNQHGIADSVKYIRILTANATLRDSSYYKYYSGKSLWLSKHNGILRTFLLSARKNYHMPMGVTPPIFKPEYTQTTLNYFTPRYFENYSIGDIVQNTSKSNFLQGNMLSSSVFITKFTSKKQITGTDSIIYNVQVRNIIEHRNKVNGQLIFTKDTSWMDSVVVTNLDMPSFATMPQEWGDAIVNYGYVGFGACVTNFSLRRLGNCVLPEIYQQHVGQLMGGEFRIPFEQEYSMGYKALQGLEYDYLDGSSGNPGGDWLRRDILYAKNTCEEVGVDITLSVKNAEVQNAVTVYPNPAVNTLTVSAQDIAAVTITDMQGKTIQHTSMAMDANNWLLDVSDFANGLYMIKVTTVAGQFVQKVVVQH